MTLKLKTKAEVTVFGAMLNVAYEIDTGKGVYDNEDEKMLMLALTGQLVSLHQKIAFIFAYNGQQRSFKLTKGQCAAILVISKNQSAADPYTAIVRNEILAKLHKAI